MKQERKRKEIRRLIVKPRYTNGRSRHFKIKVLWMSIVGDFQGF
jgi:hypothetical protein